MDSKESQDETACVVCFKGAEIYSIGQCDHPVCFECSTRMRVLCRQNECPICRQDMPKVIFTKNVQPFEKIKNGHMNSVNKFNIAFWSGDEKRAYDELLAHNCPECGKTCPDFATLRDHVRRAHQLNYCDLCVDNLKILTRERKCYSRKDLATHRRVGDSDNRSHRGHPLCQFCDTRFMDSDELYRHLRRQHLFCHFCDTDGLHQYYKTYDCLREHFRTEHYLCEEGECYNEKFTAAFRTEIDLKAHKANIHGRGLSKAGLKQARTLDIEFTLARRPRNNHRNRFREDESELGAVGGAEDPSSYSSGPQERPPNFTQINTNCIEEFPTLDGACGPAVPVPRIGPTSGPPRKLTATLCSKPSGVLYDEDFPALGRNGTSVSLRVATASTPTSTPTPVPPTKVSIQVSHPRFTTTVTSKNTYSQNFPSLNVASETSQTGTLNSSTQWTKKPQAKEPEKVVQSPAQKKRQTAPPRMEDFPALSPKENFPPKTINSLLTPSSSSTDFTQVKNAKKKTKPKPPVTSNSGAAEFKKKPPECVVNGTSEVSSRKKAKEVFDDEASAYVPQVLHSLSRKKGKEVLDEVPSTYVPRPNVTTVEMKSAKPKAKDGCKPPSLDPDAFPSLSGGPAPKVPPGFELNWKEQTSKRAPPGLAKPRSVPEPGPPPGFALINGSLPPLANPVNLSYSAPPNFEKRNTALVGKIAAALGNDELRDFKNVSIAFRGGQLPAKEYYRHCRDIMGQDTFTSLFPELFALLPDIAKQQELWPLYKSDKSRFEESASKGHRLEPCTTCRQILRASELKEHVSKHALDTHFPALDAKRPH